MKILIAYATSEGQTRKISRHISDRLADAGHAVEMLRLADASGLKIGRFDRVILAASIHVGHYQRELTEFVADHADALNEKPTLFVSVSLAAAGHDAEDWRGLDEILADFTEATNWTAGRTEQVAGAYLPSHYDLFRRFVMRRILAAKDPSADLAADKEYTDWGVLDAVVDGWLAE
ncbi:flavodoxin domain-containing protein [Thioclava atlantica]|uniref:Protoporphyrinogen oxidase n=1 Tax=Thioclava atlantica TaxID=1317124 RepID=A0A085TZK4_9RHOB|nr:flavodoxin domain-containing protein [Thioclava atlantica]KFE36151.1 protoporphyrinogen oxidase [Thioclava atlantica]